jgi:bacillithiol system protein YtxJ
MNWNSLTEESQLEKIKEESYSQAVMLLKHSTTCSISVATLSRLERAWNEEKAKNLKPYFLDLLRFRSVSNKIAEEFAIEHESPQILIIKNGKAIYDASHFNIRFDEIISNI